MSFCPPLRASTAGAVIFLWSDIRCSVSPHRLVGGHRPALSRNGRGACSLRVFEIFPIADLACPPLSFRRRWVTHVASNDPIVLRWPTFVMVTHHPIAASYADASSFLADEHRATDLGHQASG